MPKQLKYPESLLQFAFHILTAYCDTIDTKPFGYILNTVSLCRTSPLTLSYLPIWIHRVPAYVCITEDFGNL